MHIVLLQSIIRGLLERCALQPSMCARFYAIRKPDFSQGAKTPTKPILQNPSKSVARCKRLSLTGAPIAIGLHHLPEHFSQLPEHSDMQVILRWPNASPRKRKRRLTRCIRSSATRMDCCITLQVHQVTFRCKDYSETKLLTCAHCSTPMITPSTYLPAKHLFSNAPLHMRKRRSRTLLHPMAVSTTALRSQSSSAILLFQIGQSLTTGFLPKRSFVSQ